MDLITCVNHLVSFLPASCVSAAFNSCCTLDGSGCRVGSGADVCYCDQACFQNDNCCSDITEVPCFPGICCSVKLFVGCCLATKSLSTHTKWGEWR